MKPEEYEHFIKLLRDEIVRLEHANSHLQKTLADGRKGGMAELVATGTILKADGPIRQPGFFPTSSTSNRPTYTYIPEKTKANKVWKTLKRDPKTGKFTKKRTRLILGGTK